MSEGGLIVLDGSTLCTTNISLPDPTASFTGAQLLNLAESIASSSLFGISLPEHIKFSAIQRLSIANDESFHTVELNGDRALFLLRDYVTAIADELKEDPLVVAVLDGEQLRLFLDDEDDFAMLSENLFTDLDTEDKGKISKNEIRNALIHMGVELGIPPFSEFSLLNDIVQRHTAAAKEAELGQAQFAQLLQKVLQELAEALAKKHVVVIQNIKIINGFKIKKLLASEAKLGEVTEKIMQTSERSEKFSIDNIRVFFEENDKEFGLPYSKADESVALLYDEIFADIGKRNEATNPEDNIGLLVKIILEELAEKLEANPVFQNHHC